MKFKVGDIVLATKKSMPSYKFDAFLRLSPLGVGVVVDIGISIGMYFMYPIRDRSTLFYVEEEALILIEGANK
jgi:hypothetical protein